jgi:hypothetical protein
MKHLKTIFDEGAYDFTITQALNNRPDKQSMSLVLTCDVGLKKGQNLHVEFPTNPKYAGRLKRFCESINYEPFGEMYADDYGEQFIGLRCNATVNVNVDNNVLRNVAIQFALPEKQQEINPLAELKTEQYFTQTKTKKLPLL